MVRNTKDWHSEVAPGTETAYEILTGIMFKISAKNYKKHACLLSIQQEILHLISTDSPPLPSRFSMLGPHQS